MNLLRKLSALVLGLLCSSTIALSQYQDEFARWNAAVAESYAVESEINEFLASIGYGRGTPDYLRDEGTLAEGDDTVIRLLLDISAKQAQARQLAQEAVNNYYSAYFRAKLAKHGACLVSGKAKIEAKSGIVLSRTDLSLSQPQVFEARFFSIDGKIGRFRSLLGCLIQ